MVNRIILVGYVGKDPEVRHLDNNLVTARFSLATSERWTKDGSIVEHTEWFNVVAWRGLAEKVEKHVRKGSLLYVEGKFRSRTYDDKEGNKRTSFDVIADVLTFVGAKPEGVKMTPVVAAAAAAPAATQQAESIPPVETTALEPETGGDMPF